MPAWVSVYAQHEWNILSQVCTHQALDNLTDQSIRLRPDHIYCPVLVHQDVGNVGKSNSHSSKSFNFLFHTPLANFVSSSLYSSIFFMFIPLSALPLSSLSFFCSTLPSSTLSNKIANRRKKEKWPSRLQGTKANLKRKTDRESWNFHWITGAEA